MRRPNPWPCLARQRRADFPRATHKGQTPGLGAGKRGGFTLLSLFNKPHCSLKNSTIQNASNRQVLAERHSMKTNRINEIVTETLRKGGIEKFPATAMDWLVQDIESKLEADAGKRIRKFMTPALIAKAVSQTYSKRSPRSAASVASEKANASSVIASSAPAGN